MDVSFYLNRTEVGKLTGIYAHVRYSSIRLKYYLTEKIDPALWNLKEQRAKKTNRFPGYMEFNLRLDRIRDRIQEIYRTYRNSHSGQEPRPEEFKKLINDETKGQQRIKHMPFTAFFEEIYTASVKGTRVQPKSGKPFTHNTTKGYLTAINHLKAFELARRKKLEFEDITVDFHTDFTEFLIKRYKLGPNSIGKDMKNIKMAMNEAMERGLHKSVQFKSRRFTVSKEGTDSIYLNELEIQELYKIDLSNQARLERVRDLFVVGCYTGLRFSDLSSLRPGQIRDGFITLTQAKTDHEIVIPVHPVVKDILDKYNGRLPKALSNQKTNDYLKEIARLSPALDVTISKTFTKAGAKVVQNFQKWQMVSTHTQRRSFCTNEFLAGTPVELITQISGHKSPAAFKAYLRLTPTEGAQKMRDLWESRNKLKTV